MVSAVKVARRFIQASPWNGYILGRFGTLANAITDDEILSAARKEVVTIWHPCCTASMSARNASWGVVDPNLLVKGVSGLRIVDASMIVSTLSTLDYSALSMFSAKDPVCSSDGPDLCYC